MIEAKVPSQTTTTQGTNPCERYVQWGISTILISGTPDQVDKISHKQI